MPSFIHLFFSPRCLTHHTRAHHILVLILVLILDKPCAESDRRLARHLVALYHDDASQVTPPPLSLTFTLDDAIILRHARLPAQLLPATGQADAQRRRAGNVDQAFLRDFIAYARNSVAPEITDDAVEGLVQGYLAMRHMSKVRFLIRSPFVSS